MIFLRKGNKLTRNKKFKVFLDSIISYSLNMCCFEFVNSLWLIYNQFYQTNLYYFIIKKYRKISQMLKSYFPQKNYYYCLSCKSYLCHEYYFYKILFCIVLNEIVLWCFKVRHSFENAANVDTMLHNRIWRFMGQITVRIHILRQEFEYKGIWELTRKR